jgi:hypothetical protein
MNFASRTPERRTKIDRARIQASNQDQPKAPRPTSLLKAPESERYISAEGIKALAGVHYHNPVISLYLRFSPEKLVPRGKALLRFFHSIKDRALNERADWISSLSKSQTKQLSNDLDELEAFLSNHSSPEGVGSQIIFKSGAELNRVITLPVRMSDSLTIDVDPYIMPVEAALEDNQRVLFVEISWNESRFILYNLGYCQELGKIKPPIPPQPGDGDTKDGARRRLNHFEWHLKNTATKAYGLCRGGACNALILMGEERTAHFLEKYLHESLTGKIIDRIYSAAGANTRPREQLIGHSLRVYQAAKEEKTIEELRSYKPGEELASGLRDVVEASNLFLMRKLFVADGIPAKGFVCGEHQYLSFADEQCPFCKKSLLEVESVLDELLEIARLRGVGIKLFEHKPNLLAHYEGVAALLYLRASAA